jgi:hypothetical protein
MKRFISYGSIGQLRNVVDDLDYISSIRPTVNAQATEKVHGTNASVCFNEVDGLWVQSRKNIITLFSDNGKCAAFVETTVGTWFKMIQQLASDYKIDLMESTIVVYFEWAGGNIQKNSALSTLDKRAMLFPHFKVVKIDGSPNDDGYEYCQWFENTIDYAEENIFPLSECKTWNMELDFSDLNKIDEMFNKLINDIEGDSPLGNTFGVKGNIAEGVVVTFTYNDELFRFKVKGERHTASKVKTLTPEEACAEQVKVDFVNLVCTAGRLEQAWQGIFGIENEIQNPNIKCIAEFMKAVNADVIKEESDMLVEMGLTMKDVSRIIGKQASKWFITELNTF